MSRIIHKDPAGLSSKRLILPRSMFDARPERNVGQPGITEELAGVPDELLIATMIDLGCPPFAAEEVRHHPGARFMALQVWCDVQDAAEGNADAREKVDYYRHGWEEMRKLELISDRPDHTIGIFER